MLFWKGQMPLENLASNAFSWFFCIPFSDTWGNMPQEMIRMYAEGCPNWYKSWKTNQKVIQVSGWETGGCGWKEEDRKERGLEESEKWFGLCQSQHLAFCRSGGDCVDCVAQASVLPECVRCTLCQNYRRTSECQSSVCLFLCVRVFITSGFVEAQSLRQHWPVLERRVTKLWAFGLNQLISNNE